MADNDAALSTGEYDLVEWHGQLIPRDYFKLGPSLQSNTKVRDDGTIEIAVHQGSIHPYYIHTFLEALEKEIEASTFDVHDSNGQTRQVRLSFDGRVDEARIRAALAAVDEDHVLDLRVPLDEIEILTDLQNPHNAMVIIPFAGAKQRIEPYAQALQSAGFDMEKAQIYLRSDGKRVDIIIHPRDIEGGSEPDFNPETLAQRAIKVAEHELFSMLTSAQASTKFHAVFSRPASDSRPDFWDLYIKLNPNATVDQLTEIIVSDRPNGGYSAANRIQAYEKQMAIYDNAIATYNAANQPGEAKGTRAEIRDYIKTNFNAFRAAYYDPGLVFTFPDGTQKPFPEVGRTFNARTGSVIWMHADATLLMDYFEATDDAERAELMNQIIQSGMDNYAKSQSRPGQRTYLEWSDPVENALTVPTSLPPGDPALMRQTTPVTVAI